MFIMNHDNSHSLIPLLSLSTWLCLTNLFLHSCLFVLSVCLSGFVKVCMCGCGIGNTHWSWGWGHFDSGVVSQLKMEAPPPGGCPNVLSNVAHHWGGGSLSSSPILTDCWEPVLCRPPVREWSYLQLLVVLGTLSPRVLYFCFVWLVLFFISFQLIVN